MAETCVFEATCIGETRWKDGTKRGQLKALLVDVPEFDDDDRQGWVPISVVSEDSQVWRKGDSGRLVLHAWWAEKEGWV